MSAPHVEFVEMTGHIVDSLLLPKVLDTILSRGGRYHIATLGTRPSGRTTRVSCASKSGPTRRNSSNESCATFTRTGRFPQSPATATRYPPT